MILNEWLSAVAVLKSVYTTANFLPDEMVVKTWYELLKDLDFNQVTATVNKYVMINKFPPTIADIREGCIDIVSGPIDWGKGWDEVLKAIKEHGSYHPKEALESMTPITRKAVERIGFINICMSENISVERANFRMLYEEYAKRERQDSQISEALRQQILGVAERLQIGANDD